MNDLLERISIHFAQFARLGPKINNLISGPKNLGWRCHVNSLVAKKRIPILSILDTGGACHDALYGSDNAENMRTHDLQNFALYLLCMETISYSLLIT